MTLTDRLGGDLPRAPVTVELDDIQATVLRYRPEPVLRHARHAPRRGRAGRPRVPAQAAPHVDSAADWWQAAEPWISVAISYAGLVALGVPEDSLHSFPEAFRVGMAARASQLLDDGVNDPKHWERRSGAGVIHIGVSVFSDSEADVAPHDGRWRGGSTRASRPHRADPAGLRRPAGRPEPARATRTPSASPPSRAAASIRCPARDRPIKAGEFILGYPGRSRRAAADAAAGRAGTQRHVRRAAQVPVARRGVQPLPAGKRSHRGRAGAARGQAGRALAQRRAADARARPRRSRARRGPAAEQRLHLRRRPATAGRCRSARTCGA